MNEPLHIRKIDQGYCVATWDGVLMQLWRGPASVETCQQFRAIGETFLRERGPEPCSSLSIVDSRSPPPTEKVRMAMAASFRELAERMRHQIVLAEGSESRSALVRAVGLTLATFSWSQLPLQVAVSLDDAAVTLTPELSTSAGGAAGLKEAVSQLRSELEHYATR